MNDNNQREPEVTSVDSVYSQEKYQSLEKVTRPSYWGVDLDWSRRPGVPREKNPPEPFPNTRYPPEKQEGTPAVAAHGRPNKQMPPVFGTAVPMHGVSGLIKRLAYTLPDHKPTHWLLMLLSDRVDSWTFHAKRYAPYLVPLVGAAWFLERRREEPLVKKGRRIFNEAVA